METYATWARLFELLPYYSWIVDRFHVSTRAFQHQAGRPDPDFAWLEDRLLPLGFRHVLCARAPGDLRGGARGAAHGVRQAPGSTTTSAPFVREQELYRRLVRGVVPALARARRLRPRARRRRPTESPTGWRPRLGSPRRGASRARKARGKPVRSAGPGSRSRRSGSGPGASAARASPTPTSTGSSGRRSTPASRSSTPPAATALSEERLGRALGGRRERVVLSTKVGYGVPGHSGLDRALRLGRGGRSARAARAPTGSTWSTSIRARLDVLARGDVVEALARARSRPGRSGWRPTPGEGERARLGGALRRVRRRPVLGERRRPGGARRAGGEARARGIGVLGEAAARQRSLALRGSAARAGRRRGLGPLRRARALPSPPDGWTEFFARFAAHAPGCRPCWSGPASPGHLAEAVDAVRRGPARRQDVASRCAPHSPGSGDTGAAGSSRPLGLAPSPGGPIW